MNPALMATLGAALIGSGILVGIAGFYPSAPTERPIRPRRPRMHRATQIKLIAGLAGGVAAAAVTGWIVLIPLAPAAVIGIPYVLSKGGGDDIKRLDALDEWTRSLSGVLGAGSSLEQAIIATRSTAPELLRDQVDALVARLRSRMSTEQALRLFADEIGDTTADKIAMALILGARRRNVGLVAILEDLAESVGEDVAARRLVQAERAKQTTTVRWITLITLLVFGGFLLLGGAYVAPYGTPIGQPVLAVLLTIYAAVLVWLRRMNRSEPLPRLLGEDLR